MGSFAGDPLPEDACGALVAAVFARTEWHHGMPRCAVGRGAEGAQVMGWPSWPMDGSYGGHGIVVHRCICLHIFTIKLGTD